MEGSDPEYNKMAISTRLSLSDEKQTAKFTRFKWLYNVSHQLVDMSLQNLTDVQCICNLTKPLFASSYYKA